MLTPGAGDAFQLPVIVGAGPLGFDGVAGGPGGSGGRLGLKVRRPDSSSFAESY